MPAAVDTAVLKTPAAVRYCGGERIFEGLLKHHANILKPFSQTSNGARSYLVADLDAALLVARSSGTFIEEANNKQTANLRRKRR